MTKVRRHILMADLAKSSRKQLHLLMSHKVEKYRHTHVSACPKTAIGYVIIKLLTNFAQEIHYQQAK